MSNTWEIIQIIDHFNRATFGVEEYSAAHKNLEELYAQAIRLQCNSHYGYIMTVDDFISAVKTGGFIDYDGTGYFTDFDGAQLERVVCNVDWLQHNRKGATFVTWYNR